MALGEAAIPALLDDLAEEAPSRCLSYATKYGGTFAVRPRSELICGTLREIVGPRAARLWTRQEWLPWWQAEKARRANTSGR